MVRRYGPQPLMGSGQARIDDTDFLSNDTYGASDPVRDTTEGDSGVVSLHVARKQLHRAV
ncbi:hypothetical protein EV385_4171 [Krasilnikovia cinnamomea]|uniref:Uncharacterized protein n=1 Tax=Krasilnikovia cinnamomea TaxID=349313 RepID=A0A4Q7ZPQ3_9ACTN|nr:hypothetical protein [Krasilnikovia cinnamomea]RZU52319.1 hypothetical protein EV385_4171 [Krasilnikovia cinnamomea]